MFLAVQRTELSKNAAEAEEDLNKKVKQLVSASLPSMPLQT
jgi:hypothetical protein